MIPDAAIDEIAAKTGIGRWHLRFALYDGREINEIKLRKAVEAFGAIPGARIILVRMLSYLAANRKSS